MPSGLTSALPAIAARRRALEDRLFAVFLDWGYREVIPPLFEFRDVIAVGLDPVLLEKAYTVVDRHTGRLMVLRPDVTPQVARMAAQSAPGGQAAGVPFPLRLCYRATVFRHEDPHAGREREILQVGGELIGWAGPEADAEPIAMAVEAIRRTGLRHFKIALGHVGYLGGLLEASGVPKVTCRQIAAGMARRDRGLVESLIRRAGLGAGQRARLLAPLELLGGAEVLAQARRLLRGTGSGRSRAALALDRLRHVYEALQADGLGGEILIDLGETRGFEYYTGVVFEIFADREVLGGGGRYDGLMGQFGRPSPATGLAVDVERLHRVLNARSAGDAGTVIAALAPAGSERLDVLLCHDHRPLPLLARRLRARGYRVATCPLPARPLSLRRLLTSARAHQADRVVIAGSAGGRLTVVDTRTGVRKTISADALAEGL